MAGERDARALITQFYLLAILVTAEGGPGCQAPVSEGLDGRKEGYEEMSIQLVVSLPPPGPPAFLLSPTGLWVSLEGL